MTKARKTSTLLGRSVGRLAGDGLVLDLQQLSFIRPATLALICSHVDLIIHGDIDRRVYPQMVIVDEPKNKTANNYLKGMNFYGAAQGRGITSMGGALEAQHVPLHPLRSSDEVTMIAINLARIILSKLPAAQALTMKSALHVTLGELLENFKAHSETNTRAGIVCAQYYPPHRYNDSGNARTKGLRADFNPRRRRGAIEIAVADTGIGIEASLRRNPAYAHRIGRVNPCEFATQLGVTSKPDKHHGYGLYVSRRLAERNRGELHVISGRHWFSVVRGVRESGTSVETDAWPGTFIGLKLFPEQPINLNAIYAEMGPPEDQ